MYRVLSATTKPTVNSTFDIRSNGSRKIPTPNRTVVASLLICNSNHYQSAVLEYANSQMTNHTNKIIDFTTAETIRSAPSR